MKLIENIALAFAAFLCVGVMEMAVAAAGVALEAWREGIGSLNHEVEG